MLTLRRAESITARERDRERERELTTGATTTDVSIPTVSRKSFSVIVLEILSAFHCHWLSNYGFICVFTV